MPSLFKCICKDFLETAFFKKSFPYKSKTLSERETRGWGFESIKFRHQMPLGDFDKFRAILLAVTIHEF